jgi:hypothetical protein
MRAVDHRLGPVELAGGVHIGKQELVQPVSSGVSPRNPAITIRKFQGGSTDMNTVHTGLVKEGKTDVVAFTSTPRSSPGSRCAGSRCRAGWRCSASSRA